MCLLYHADDTPKLQEELNVRTGWCLECENRCQNLDKVCVEHYVRLRDCMECKCDGADGVVVHEHDSIREDWKIGWCVLCMAEQCAYADTLCVAHGLQLRECWECYWESRDNHVAPPTELYTARIASVVGPQKRKHDDDASSE